MTQANQMTESTSLNPRLTRQMEMLPRIYPASYYKHSNAALVYSVTLFIVMLAASIALAIHGCK